jgi:DNA-binding CsgD family transcriptional regulator
MSNSYIEYLLKFYGAYGLTRRESECFWYVVRGLNTKKIARHLRVSDRTVEKFIINLREKLGCLHKNDLIERAYQDGLISFLSLN